MKKNVFFLTLTLFLMSFTLPGNTPIRGSLVVMQVAGSDRDGLDVQGPRGIIEPPTVSIDGRTLYFYDVFSSTVPVVIVDSNDEVVFSDYLYCGADKIMLPASLTGTFTVYMRVGTILYYGNFNV